MINNRKMKVLMLPYYKDNSYQELLSRSLEKHGVTIEKDGKAHPFHVFLQKVLAKNPDVIHFHWTHPYFLFGSKKRLYKLPGSKILATLAAVWFLIQVKISKYSGKTLVWTVHNLHSHEKKYTDLDYWVSKQLARIVDTVHVWDKNTCEMVSESYGIEEEKIVEIPHGNYIPKYESEENIPKNEARNILGIETCQRVYLYFGMIRRYKNVPKLIETFDNLESDTCLYIAGNPYTNEQKEEVQNVLSLSNSRINTDLRYIPDEEVPTLFSAADAAIFPYQEIFNSGSVILAMSFGRAFMAPNMGSIPSIAPDGNIVYDNLDVGLKKLDEMSIDEFEAIGQKNLRQAKEKLGWDDIGKKTKEMYVRS